MLKSKSFAQDNKTKTVLITGGAGYVGTILLRKLLQEGYAVDCLDNLSMGGESLLGVWQHSHFSFHKCDITNHEQLYSVMKKKKYYAVVHLAAIVGDPACKRNPDLAKKVNGEASEYLFQRSQDLGVERFVFASTCSNYGKMSDPLGYVDETSALAPVSLYADLKVRFEEFMMKSRGVAEFCPTILRFSTVFGVSPRMRFDLTVNEFTKELALGKELVVYGEQFWRPYCHVVDFSRAIIAVLQAESSKVAYNVFNVGDTGQNYTKGMIIEELLRHFPDAKIKRVEKQEDPRDYRVKFEKIQTQLGFRSSRTVPDGIDEIKKVIQWGIIPNPEEPRYYNVPYQP